MMSGPTLYELCMEAADGESFAAAMNVVDYLLALGRDELRVLSFIARRLEDGRAEHGPLDIMGDKRNWRVELGEEAGDALVYAAAEAIRTAPPHRHHHLSLVRPGEE